MEVSGQFHAPAALFLGKNIVPPEQGAGWAQAGLGGLEKRTVFCSY
jgi:hypothetical protein